MQKADDVTPRAEYTRRIAQWNAELARHERAHGVIANLRLLTAAGAIGAAAMVMRNAWLPWTMLVPTAVFVALMAAHARVLGRADGARRARALYERGLARIDGTWQGAGPDGAHLLTGQPFAADLDLFGAGSLFQLLHTARTEAGETTLASWLLAGAQPAEVLARQHAVAELRDALEFRESLAIAAGETHTSRTGVLATWATGGGGRLWAGLLPLFAIVGLIGTALLIAAFRNQVDGRIVLIWLAAQGVLGLAFWRRCMAALAGIDVAARDLSLLSSVLARLEASDFTSPKLKHLRASLSSDAAPPSRQIARLLRLVDWLDSTRNVFFAPIALSLMVPFQLAVAISLWHQRNAPSIERWLTAVGEAEALVSLATFAYEHPDDPFPTIVEHDAVFEATGLAHPLIAEAAAVRNDVALGGAHPHLLLVSGSNMSGKSTLLRAIGVNVVLALAGAPVRATSLRVSPLTIGASLRIDDSLQAGHSRFYAEILRIRAIVDLTRGSQPVLFLLDEVLAGTNSHDRRIGAEAIVRTLVAHGAIGLVTTHDLALADVVATMNGLATNVHFEDRIEDGKMVFDYHMRPGVVTHSNALALMRAVGLDV